MWPEESRVCGNVKELSRRQARWEEIVSSYDFVIKHLAGIRNQQNGPSRQPHHKIGNERPDVSLSATLTAVESYNNLQQVIKTAQATYTAPANIINKIAEIQWPDTLTWQRMVEWRVQRTRIWIGKLYQGLWPTKGGYTYQYLSIAKW